MSIQIRTACIGDACSIVELLRALEQFPHIHDEPEQETRGRVEAQLRLCLSDESHTIFLALDEDGTPAGFLSIHWLPYMILKAPEGYISELFVCPAARGRGIGRLLLDAAGRESRARGCSRMSLLNFRNRESYQRQFYMKNGWVERAEAANFVFAIPLEPGGNATRG